MVQYSQSKDCMPRMSICFSFQLLLCRCTSHRLISMVTLVQNKQNKGCDLHSGIYICIHNFAERTGVFGNPVSTDKQGLQDSATAFEPWSLHGKCYPVYTVGFTPFIYLNSCAFMLHRYQKQLVCFLKFPFSAGQVKHLDFH